MTRQLLAIALVLALVVPAFAARNIKGLDQDGNVIYVKAGSALGYRFTSLSENSTVYEGSGIAFYNSSTGVVATAYSIPVGQTMIVTQTDNGTAGHTFCLPTGMTFNGTSVNATFNAQYETLIFMGVASDRVVIIENIGTVGFQ